MSDEKHEPDHAGTKRDNMSILSQQTIQDYIDAELHARPYLTLSDNQRVFYFAFRTGEQSTAKEWSFLVDIMRQCYGWTEASDEPDLPDTPPRFFLHEEKGIIHRYERHTEFASLAVIFDGAVKKKGRRPDYFPSDGVKVLPEHLVALFPGDLIVATWIDMSADHRSLVPADVEKIFLHDNFAGSIVADHGAKVYCSMKLEPHQKGEFAFTKILVQNNGLSEQRTGRLIQRLLEIETYRHFAMISLPMVNEIKPQLSKTENRLSNISKEMGHIGNNEPTDVLQHQLIQITNVTAKIEKLSALTSYRLAATKAYDALVRSRLKELRETRMDNFQTLAQFLERRLVPAVRTCFAFQNRLEDVALRAQRSNTLLRTRIEMQIQIQNNALLSSMENRAKQQLRLQEIVELLSIAAITYYLVSLLSYVLKGMASENIRWESDTILAWSVPVIAILLFIVLKLVRKSMN